MPKVRVQQFHETDDEFHELGGLQVIDLTEAELTALQDHDGEITWLEGRREYFGLADEEHVKE
ncbi:hypothetical protein [Paraburkholderia oxyphila]|uniref:hypothetical protein n=1 Tax=Paraburkholderia oxyphila TaxID=614212 RepID=UPI0004873C19|nr:hypothetical protein [Paraburkholderia oxyphila]